MVTTTANTVPADYFVSVTPSVVSDGSTGVDTIGLFLSTSNRVPIGQVLSFPSASGVSDYFGSTSTEAIEAGVYFAGYTLGTIRPSSLLFAQYPATNVGAYLRGGPVSGLTLAQLQAISGVLTVTTDGVLHTSSSINLASATSFTGAAQLITNGLGLTGPTQATGTASVGATCTGTGSGTNLTLTSVVGVIHPGSSASASIAGTGVPGGTYIISQTSGTTGGAGVYVTNNSTTSSSAAITVTSTTMDVTGGVTTVIAIGQEAFGTGLATGSYITALGTSTGGVGTVILTTAQQVASTAIIFVLPTVTYDSQSGAFVLVSSTTGASSTVTYGSGTIAASIALTQATGAVLSQGAAATTPAAFMASVIAVTTNWATFTTLFDPDSGSGNTVKLAFAAWTNSANNRYMYLAPDNDITPTLSNAATSSLGFRCKTLGYSGTVPLYEPSEASGHLAAFAAGFAASIAWTMTNGRATLAYKTQAGLAATVINRTVAANLEANGYNYQVAAATAGANWSFFWPGSVTGPDGASYLWFDSFLNQIWLNNQCQIALMNLLVGVGSIPYNPIGYAQIRQVLGGGATGGTVTLPPASPIAAALNNGVIRAGVPLSALEVIEVNALAGQTVDRLLTQQGWVIVIQPATAAVRAARGSPPIILLYMDGQSVQRMNLASVLVQ